VCNILFCNKLYNVNVATSNICEEKLLYSVELRIERFNAMRSINVQSQEINPEEDALKKVLEIAKNNNLSDKPWVRLFGRNFYPTTEHEPHGYEYYLTIEGEIKPSREIVVRNIPDGLYATLRVKGVSEIAQGWRALFSMVEASGYKPVGVSRQIYGWATAGFEEIINWQHENSPQAWNINLWLQLKE
jgi:effector-binding domain-containing protein